ncbi:ATP-binding protein [Allostreptomyces psammosilenae]|uniref:Histidine kinase/HSP90-like ATPase domain-containing protein n=1 Tax=Allostreptomyces psammosilenae TaxID=1892865 RepID=A0A852ZY89_9ACTN|nr:ATP-binding protein [Allostreptomyces psammosilenae]NYI03591.1 hypothetical protein [Allostreptomyces psammosilenae]
MRRWPPLPASVGAARWLVRDRLTVWCVPADSIDTAELLTSELLTNAVVHAAVPEQLLELTVLLHDDHLRIAVSDACPTVPEPRAADSFSESPRGLTIVQALAHDWGTDARAPRGKTVWCLLKLPLSASRPTPPWAPPAIPAPATAPTPLPPPVARRFPAVPRARAGESVGRRDRRP